jgi:hypothetical protein
MMWRVWSPCATVILLSREPRATTTACGLATMRDLWLIWVADTPAQVGREPAREPVGSKAAIVKIRPASRQAGRHKDQPLPTKDALRTLDSSTVAPDPQEAGQKHRSAVQPSGSIIRQLSNFVTMLVEL